MVVGLVLGIVALVQKKDKGIGLCANIVAAIILYFGGAHAAEATAKAIGESAAGAAAIEELSKSLEESASALNEAAAAEESVAATEEAVAEEAVAEEEAAKTE